MFHNGQAVGIFHRRIFYKIAPKRHFGIIERRLSGNGKGTRQVVFQQLPLVSRIAHKIATKD